MARFNDIINSFSSGEVTPRLYGRTDSDAYRKGAKELLNMYSVPQGGVRRRSGTESVLSPWDLDFGTATYSKVIPFVISEDEKYLILIDSQGFSSPFHVYNPDDQYFKLIPSKSVGAPFATFNSNIFDSSSDADVKKLQYTQIGDLLFFTHPDAIPFYIARLSRNNLSYQEIFVRSNNIVSGFGDLTVLKSVPTDDINRTSTTMSVATATGASVVITASAAYFETGTNPGVKLTSIMSFEDAGNVGWGIIISVTSSTVATITIHQAIPTAFVGANSSSQWHGPAWHAGDYPRSVVGRNGSIYYGGTQREPSKIWKSQDFDLFELTNDRVNNAAATPLATDPVSRFISSNSSSKINWMISFNSDILVGTSGGEFSIKGMTGSDIPDIRPQSNFGAEEVPPVIIDGAPIFVQRGGKKIRSLDFDFNINGYTSTDISLLSEHLFSLSLQKVPGANTIPKIIAMASQASPNSILWALDSNNYLFSATIKKQGKIKAWGRVEIAGTDNTRPFAKILSIAVIPSSENGEDALYMLVQRRINSQDLIYLEAIDSEFGFNVLNSTSDIKKTHPIFADAAKVVRTRPVPTFWATYSNNGNADVAAGSLILTLSTGTVTFPGHRLSLGAANAHIEYSGAANIDTAVNTGTIGFSAPNLVNGITTLKRVLFTMSRAHADVKNLIEVYTINAQRELWITINDAAGALIVNQNMVTLSTLEQFIDSEIIHIEVGFDLTGTGGTNHVYLFINGTLISHLTPAIAGTRDNNIGLFRIGADVNRLNGVSIAAMEFRDFFVYDTVQHTKSFVYYPIQDKSSVIRNLNHLREETVAVVGDGKYVGDFLVSSIGRVTMAASDLYDTLIIGLSYTHRIEGLPSEFGASLGTAQGEIKRIDEVVARFQDTAACSFKSANQDLTEISFRDSSDDLDTPIPLVTGDKVLEFDGDYDRNATVILEGDKPLPCNITCLIYKGITYG